ncbi:hypothetical protein EJV47_00455 [Hymenobacter gummosus]|uniref:Uncharacterized protein n=1 Tax=Hymenobacter gummosus TaxID=1776032 RepID=A0A431U8U8_9BACT|nr:hypothetical protein [Hymenobacter gummosus]RTQ53246.1 hypothetical protein EJV47_00455 [Hymenobacter gummosus]
MAVIEHETITQQYGTARLWRLLTYVLAPVVIVGFLIGAYFMVREDPTDKNPPALSYGLAAVLLGFAGLFAYGLLDVIRWRLIITPTRIISAGAFRTRELALNNIRGFRTDENYTRVLPRWEGQPAIKIGYTTEDYAGLQQWLAQHYPDLDVEQEQESEAAILADTRLGADAMERADRLAAARRTATVLNWLSGGVAAWLLFRPQPYAWAVGAALAVPLVAVAALWRHPGVLRVDENKNSAYPSIAWALLLPSLALLWRSATDVQLVAYSPLWPRVGTVAATMVVLLIAGNRYFLRQRTARLNTIVAAVICGLFYSYGATVAANAAFDQATGTLYHPRVQGKHVSSGKTTTHYLTVEPWGSFHQPDDVVVSSRYYRRTPPGATVTIRLSPGWLGIPWYQVVE